MTSPGSILVKLRARQSGQAGRTVIVILPVSYKLRMVLFNNIKLRTA
uniref:Uncharacterized protein n=1 Tax=Anguilla anguilla TaxID=7936 RepID=A0A0E9VFB1_ANGAN